MSKRFYNIGKRLAFFITAICSCQLAIEVKRCTMKRADSQVGDLWRHHTQHNDIHHNDIQHNDT